MFQRTNQNRIKVVLLIVILIFIAISIRILYLQLFNNKLNKLAKNLWQRNLPITADRGEILDRNGKILATNITTTTIYVIPNQIKDKEDAAKKISEVLNCNYDDILKHLTKRTSIERINEGRQLDKDTSDKINDLNIDGVYLLKESKRYYPYNTLLSHTLGYVGAYNQGLSGLELKYDEYLTGKDGMIKYTSDGKGNRLNNLEVYERPTDGMNLTLTIDIDIQKALERELEVANNKYNPDEALGIVIDPNSGELLALASLPTFDSNNYKDYDVEVINRNLPIWKNYEPGSTFKILTLSAALEEKKINLFEDHFYDSGHIKVASARINCWKHEGHGSETFLQVVQNSCNPGFVVMGQKLGKDKLYEYVEKFGFTSKTGIDLNGEATGIMFKKDKIGPVEQATISFGQGISVTPIQQVVGVSSAINGGTLYKPYILKYITESNTNNIVMENKKTEVRKTISEETSKLVRETLESVVSEGTGKNAFIENYRVGGKTGTAQKVKDGMYMTNNYITSFIGFFPADNPKYLVYIAIDNAKGVTQYGGTIAAPIAKNVMKSIINIKNEEPSKEPKERTYTWLDTKYKKAPDLIGKTIKEAKQLSTGFNLEYSGDGDKIIYQEPESDVYIKENSTIKVLLN